VRAASATIIAVFEYKNFVSARESGETMRDEKVVSPDHQVSESFVATTFQTLRPAPKWLRPK